MRIVGGCFFRQANLQRLHFFCKRTQLLVILAAPGNLSNFHLEWMEGAMQDFPFLLPSFSPPLAPTTLSVDVSRDTSTIHPHGADSEDGNRFQLEIFFISSTYPGQKEGRLVIVTLSYLHSVGPLGSPGCRLGSPDGERVCAKGGG